MQNVLADLYPLGDHGLEEVPYRHYFELQHLQKIVKFNKNMNVLELGCGTGRWIVSLAPMVNHYAGVDFNNKSLVIAKNEIDKLGISNVVLYNQSIVDFKGDRLYDIIYLSGVTQYIEDDQLFKVLINLKPFMKRSTIIIDRSTVNYKNRDMIKTEKYYSIYRTFNELYMIYKKCGLRCGYIGKSYEYLRGITLPSMYLMLIESRILNRLFPINRDWEHVFFVFKRCG
jgi:ubiquinone/menaquinone biosynthesis C-methylase UbiE